MYTSFELLKLLEILIHLQRITKTQNKEIRLSAGQQKEFIQSSSANNNAKSLACVVICKGENFANLSYKAQSSMKANI